MLQNTACLRKVRLAPLEIIIPECSDPYRAETIERCRDQFVPGIMRAAPDLDYGP